MSKQMTAKDINTMLRMYENGSTAKEIGQEIGRSPSVVSSTLARMKKQLTCRDTYHAAPVERMEPEEYKKMLKEHLRRERYERALFLGEVISYFDKFKKAHYPSWIFENDDVLDYSPSSVQDTDT
jgi:DNA-binding CsgD family transcriptional regulator